MMKMVKMRWMKVKNGDDKMNGGENEDDEMNGGENEDDEMNGDD